MEENRQLKEKLRERYDVGNLVGTSHPMQKLFEEIAQAAPANTTVLIQGESGTGKELIATAIHREGPRAAQPFVAINCGAIPEGLIESELFGHEKGSFTGAVGAKPGLFEVAGSGTLFLDEVGELPPPVQVKLLRVLQERRIRRVGGQSDISVSARIVAATNRDLEAEVRAGRFREDLFYRLNVIQVRMPPLRDRTGDIPALADHFLERFAGELGRKKAALAPEALRLLQAHGWPGNIRELANVLERAATLAEGDVIGPAVFPPSLRGGPAEFPPGPVAELPADGLDLQAHLDAIERRLLEQALERTSGVKTEAARLLSLTFRSLRYRLAKYGIGEGA
jgi:two-component system response regulator PilR (NtrC family)